MRKLFIVGCPRSGTTALYQLLRYHDDAMWFTPEMKERYGFKIDEKIRSGYPMFKNDVLPKAVECPLRIQSNSIFNMYETNVSTKVGQKFRDAFDRCEECWGYDDGIMLTKFPRFGLQMKALKKIFPDAKFLHIVRDGRAVINSLMKRLENTGQIDSGMWGCTPPNSDEHWSEPMVQRCAFQWNEMVKIIDRDGKEMGDDYYAIRYEDLCKNTEDMVRNVCKWLEILDEDKMMLMKCFYNDMKEAKHWKKVLSKLDVGFINRFCREELKKWGYI